MSTISKWLLTAVVVLLPRAALPAEFVLVANPSVAATSLSRAEASRLFMKLQTTWPGGAHVRPVDQPKGSPVREAFSREVLGRSVEQVEQAWTQAIFSGRAVPPVEKRTDADVVAYVRETPGAVGYVAASAPSEGVKKLALKD